MRVRRFSTAGSSGFKEAIRWAREEATFQYGKATAGMKFNLQRPTGTKTLFDFTLGSDNTSNDIENKDNREPQRLIDQWLVSSDRAVGGKSQCTFMPGTGGGAIFSGELSLDHAEDVTTTAATPSMTGGDAALTKRKQAYCAIRAKVPRRVRDCTDYQGLEMKIRADAHIYAVNVTAKSFFPDDLYQGFIKQQPQPQQSSLPLSETEWTTVVLPFTQFVLTSYGYAKEEQRELETEFLKTVGFTVVSDKEGPFSLEIAWVRAVATVEPELLNTQDQTSKEEDRRERIAASIQRRKQSRRSRGPKAHQT